MVGTTTGAARPDEIRRHNLALMLAHVHRDGALTRAELTQRLGVSRSTVGSLVGDLTQLGLLEEVVPTGGAGASAGVGRPSHLVGPHRAGPYALAIDVDVEHTTLAAVGLGGEVRARDTVPTSAVADPVKLVEIAAAAAPRIGGHGWVAGVGVSVPGTVHPQTLSVGLAPNLGWRDVPLGNMLRAALPRVPLAIGNDADLAVVAEHQWGSARGSDDVVFLMVRVGLGAGIITGGVALRGRSGNAGEIGHIVLDPSGPACHCGKRGCAETYVGDRAQARLDGHRGPESDRVLAEHVGHVIGNLVNTVDPSCVLMGGSLTRLLEVARPELDAAVQRYAMVASDLELRSPGLGDDSALLGAAEAAFARLLADPLGNTAT